jgi:hypothetical protein
LRNQEYGPIETWGGIVLRKKDVSSSAAAGVGFIEETGVRVGAQDHITRPVHNAVRQVGGYVV